MEEAPECFFYKAQAPRKFKISSQTVKNLLWVFRCLAVNICLSNALAFVFTFDLALISHQVTSDLALSNMHGLGNLHTDLAKIASDI